MIYSSNLKCLSCLISHIKELARDILSISINFIECDVLAYCNKYMLHFLAFWSKFYKQMPKWNMLIFVSKTIYKTLWIFDEYCWLEWPILICFFEFIEAHVSSIYVKWKCVPCRGKILHCWECTNSSSSLSTVLLPTLICKCKFEYKSREYHNCLSTLIFHSEGAPRRKLLVCSCYVCIIRHPYLFLWSSRDYFDEHSARSSSNRIACVCNDIFIAKHSSSIPLKYFIAANLQIG